MQNFITKTVNWFINQSRVSSMVLGLAYLAVIGFFDYLTGFEFTMSLFYMLPISLYAWNLGRTAGLLMAVLCAAIEFIDQAAGGRYFPNLAYELWDSFISMSMYVSFGLILAELRRAYDREKVSARKDFLTGLANYHAFVEFSTREIERSKRYNRPLTILFMDCDNFKAINDTLGHQAGNMLLREVGIILQKIIRSTDMAARIGGDEFAIFLAETEFRSAGATTQKIHNALFGAMQRNNWPVTFSIGAASFVKAPGSFDEMIGRADSLMHIAKLSGKNIIKHEAVEEVTIRKC